MYQKIESFLMSGEYQCQLSASLTSIFQKTKLANSEATVASIFENELYYFLKQYFNKEITFFKESGESYLRHKFDGRMDAMSNNLIIEYKASDKLNTNKEKDNASKQIKNYLYQLKRETNLSYHGILTNGSKISFFYFINDDIKQTPFRSIGTSDLDRIIKALLNVGNKQFVPQNILNDFKLSSPSNITLDLCHVLFNKITNNMTEKTNMLYQEWEVLFRLSESDKGKNQDIVKRRKALSNIFKTVIDNNETDYKALFVLQTAYAIIVKLIACKVISKLAFNESIMFFSDLSEVDNDQLHDFIINLEDGYVFSAGGIRNLLEGDFFSWYSDARQWDDDIAMHIKKIITVLEDYSSSSFVHEYRTIDIFKDLYIEIIPNEVRHSLGEYFTPAWLADQVVNEAIKMIENKDWKAIDPCCGSGVFLMALIRKIIGEQDIYDIPSDQKNNLLQSILERVQGIDINPLSVLTARVSYMLSILPLVENQKFEIPIYLGDSANIPQKTILGETPCYKYVINTKQGKIDVELPCKFVESEGFFEKMSLLQTTIKAEDVDLVYDKFIEEIGEARNDKKVTDKIYELSNSLVNLHINQWDGIWIRIVSNFMLIARISNQDIIIGNPPWVKWEFLPQNYANTIKSLCLERHLFSGQNYMGAISLNLCALIANVTGSSWLNDNGVLAFLMPKTIMTQDSYAGFRDFYTDYERGKRLYLQRVDDWSKAGNPFVVTQEKFMTYFYKHDYIDYSNGIPINYIIKKRNKSVVSLNWYNEYEQVKEYIDESEGMAYQLDEDRTGFTMVPERNFENLKNFKKIIGKSDYKARSGVEFTPAEIYFVEPIKDVFGTKDTFFFKNSSFENSIYKAKYKKMFELETKYIKPVIKGPCIKTFYIEDSNNYCIFPYKEGEKECVGISDLMKESPILANYFIDNKSIIEKQSNRSRMITMGNDFYALSKVGIYTFADYYVTFRDNTKLDAAVVKKVKSPWGEEIMPVCAKHAPYISMDKYGAKISEDEAYYISAILNAPIVGSYFRYTYSGRSYSINFNIKIPKYNDDNKLQKQLVTLARDAHEKYFDEEYINTIKEQINNVYLKLCSKIK